MILAYRILTTILYPFIFVYLYFRVSIKKESPERYKEKILSNHFNVKKNNNLKLLWFHATSIGEFKSIIPIIEELNKNLLNYEFLITTTTLSSSILAKSELKKFKNAHHRFIPFDLVHLIEKFLDLWKPEKIFLVDSEIWPNLILKASSYQIPIALINARITKKSFDRWSMFPKTAEKIFKNFSLCLCSNYETKIFLKKLKAKNVRYEGNIKLINKLDNKEFNNVNEALLKKLRFWIAASIHKEEDLTCLKTHIELKKNYKDIVTIIAPRHIDRAEKIKKQSEKLNLKTQILNKGDIFFADMEIIIINSYGVLQEYFLYAKSVFIGKSLIKRLKNDSGQNPIDAAYLNCKIYHGPYVSNFKEIYEILKKNHISDKIKSHKELGEKLIKDLKNPKKSEINFSKNIETLGLNILSKTIAEIQNFLNDKIK